MNMSLAPTPWSRPAGSLRTLAPLALILAAGGLGCFRATGIARPTVAVEEIPASGGDRVGGLKATAGSGDFYLGNDSVQLAVDGAAFGDREGQFGAASGGGILDVGHIELDLSYKRVGMPTDMLERLGPVANQDPDLPLVFDRYLPSATADQVQLDMEGGLLDPKGKLGVSVDGRGRVAGVTVSHRITLKKGENFFTLETTLANASGATLPLRNLGDHLSQHGGGFRFAVPAVTAFDGTPLSSWGVEIPGTDFSAPLTGSVVAPMVALMGSESAGATLDSHLSLGLMPLDGESLLVASDSQAALTENRPRVPGRLVVGAPAVPSLAEGQVLTYRRRLYVVGGTSVSSLAPALIVPAQATTVFNEMVRAKATLQGGDVALLYFNSFGTAMRGGPLQTEFRVERYTYTGTEPFDPGLPGNPATLPENWRLERVEWREATDVPSASSLTGLILPVVSNPATGQPQPFRFIARNRSQQGAPMILGTNALDSNRFYLPTPIAPTKTQPWQLAEALSPERSDVLDENGNVIRQLQTAQYFSARAAGNLDTGSLTPLRIVFQGLGVPDPDMQRVRTLSSFYSPVLKGKAGASVNYGAYQYRAGNQVFGTAFGSLACTAAAFFSPGDYLAYATRGPLSYLDSIPLQAHEGQGNTAHTFVVTPPVLPTGWTTFDVPGPTQATTGGLNPGEMLSSAVAEGVQVVTRTEEDLLTDPTALRSEFRAEIDNEAVTDIQRAPLGNDPFVVGARSSSLADGFATALFTPAPTGARNGGARPSAGWTLADFITQAEGAFTVVHRPRGPQGLFTLKGFDPATPLGSGANAWWTQVGPLSLGKRQGDFDALELIRAEGCDPADPTAWFAEFKATREDWFALLKQQQPGAFTKALGLSSSRFSLDTPVGLGRTYLKLASGATLGQADLSPVLTALKSGAAVASTGPLLEVEVNGTGPGGLVGGPVSTATLTISLYAPDWVPVDEVRVVVNGVVQVVPLASFTASTTDFRLRTASLPLTLPAKDAWVVVEAGVPLATTGAYRADTPWSKIMKGIYPIAVTNPVFVDVDGGGYTPPGL